MLAGEWKSKDSEVDTRLLIVIGEVMEGRTGGSLPRVRRPAPAFDPSRQPTWHAKEGTHAADPTCPLCGRRKLAG
nr:hypothetical protein Iba_chr03bCG13760 [Ipomoea batatas]